MGVYIKGMEMPKNCSDCPMCYDMMQCSIAEPIINFFKVKVKEFDFCTERHPRCPLVPVPPHGRLIDADTLMFEIQEYIEEYSWETDEHGWHNEKWCAMKEAAMAIDAAPTIIEAEEGE